MPVLPSPRPRRFRLRPPPAPRTRLKFSQIMTEVRDNIGMPSKALVFMLRSAQSTHGIPVVRNIVRGLYRLVCIVLRVDIPWEAEFGPGLRIDHPFSIAINSRTRIGARCLIRHGVTLGNRFDEDKTAPIVGDDVKFGCYAVVVGPVQIPSGAQVASLSLTTVKGVTLADPGVGPVLEKVSKIPLK